MDLSQAVKHEKMALIIGQSHTEAVSQAISDRPSNDLVVINYNRPQDESFRRGVFNPEMVAGIHPDYVVSMISGNFHNVLGLIEYPTRLNFMAATDQADSVSPDRMNIPYSVMYEYLNTVMRNGFLKVLNELKKLYNVPICHICSPPPNPDSRFIEENPGGFFADKVHLGVTPPDLRLRLYQLHTLVFKEYCDENGITFVPPPAAAVDENGFLAKPYWRRDPTHANKAYGALVIQQIRALMGA